MTFLIAPIVYLKGKSFHHMGQIHLDQLRRWFVVVSKVYDNAHGPGSSQKLLDELKGDREVATTDDYIDWYRRASK